MATCKTMLLSSRSANFVIVEMLDLDFAPGFTVLTGETGAGKSILIDALQLALGERADADVGARARVALRSAPNSRCLPKLRVARRQRLEGDDDIALARRVVEAGRPQQVFYQRHGGDPGQFANSASSWSTSMANMRINHCDDSSATAARGRVGPPCSSSAGAELSSQ